MCSLYKRVNREQLKAGAARVRQALRAEQLPPARAKPAVELQLAALPIKTHGQNKLKACTHGAALSKRLPRPQLPLSGNLPARGVLLLQRGAVPTTAIGAIIRPQAVVGLTSQAAAVTITAAAAGLTTAAAIAVPARAATTAAAIAAAIVPTTGATALTLRAATGRAAVRIPAAATVRTPAAALTVAAVQAPGAATGRAAAAALLAAA